MTVTKQEVAQGFSVKLGGFDQAIVYEACRLNQGYRLERLFTSFCVWLRSCVRTKIWGGIRAETFPCVCRVDPILKCVLLPSSWFQVNN